MSNTIQFPMLGDARGSLVVLEAQKQIPFDIQRVYYIFGTQEGIARGFHAHKELLQVAVCVSGQCKMLLDNGNEKTVITMDSPTHGVLIDRMVWHEMHDFSSDCVLLVLASAHYDEADYIRNYDDFTSLSSIEKGRISE
ncbi:sugar 3,4-ketoisomerase [Paenalcaligenes sp. Me52]|uniref:sugar 3,4-ketoisomerase n=1 Tax=Paenalcaligenes sp. Me52 TaxID=3392038 RepID=UPI003D2B1AA4